MSGNNTLSALRRSMRPAMLVLVAVMALSGCLSVAPSPSPEVPASPPPTGTSAATPSPAPATPAPPPTDSPTTSPSITLGPSPTNAPTSSPSPSPTTSPSPTVGPSPTTPPTPASDHAARLGRALDVLRETNDIPGLNAAVLFPDGTLWTGGSGFAQLAERTPAGEDTPFVVGSISKTFVAALVMLLAEEGQLGLDDPIARWLPDYPEAESITVRQLLNHSSGVFNYFEHPTYNRSVFGDPRREWAPEEIVTTFDAAPYFAPGAGYHYSNTGFVLLGMIIEQITGNSLGAEYRARFFEPLGMSETYFQGDGPLPSVAAHGYLVGDAGPRLVNDGTDYRPTTSAATVAWAAGAVASTPGDLATWANALYGGELLSGSSLDQMTDFRGNPYAGGLYGLGTRTRLIHGRQAVGHTGSLRGFAASMWHFPDEGLTVVVLSNRGRLDVNPLAERLAAVALRAIGYSTP